MDATELLTQDHLRLRDLFRNFHALDPGDTAGHARLLEDIRRELDLHTRCEEEIFYPALAGALPEGGQERVEESIESHLLAHELLTDLLALQPIESSFQVKVQELERCVERHVVEEERDLLPVARTVLAPQQLEALAEEIRAYRTAEEQLPVGEPLPTGVTWTP